MAVQQNRKSRSRRDMRRSHDALTVVTTYLKMVSTVVVNYSLKHLLNNCRSIKLKA